MKELNGADLKDAIATGTVLIDLGARWCGPCKMLTPILEDLSKEMPNIMFHKLDVDDYPEQATELSVRSLPALILFRDGKEVERTIGARPKDGLKKWIEEALAKPTA